MFFIRYQCSGLNNTYDGFFALSPPYIKINLFLLTVNCGLYFLEVSVEWTDNLVYSYCRNLNNYKIILVSYLRETVCLR